MALQVKRAGPEDYGTWVKALIGGEPGAGKTRTASTWPGVLYANAEGGQLSVADRRPHSIDIDSMALLTELQQVLTQKREVRERMLGLDVETVVVDTFDEIARLFIRERVASERKETMAIQDWGWLGDRLRDFVRGWRNLEMNVLFLVHMKAQEDSETGRVVYKPSIQGAMGDEIAAYVDLALLLRAQPTTQVVNGQNVRVIQRFLQTYPDAQHPWVKDRSGRLPMDFPINLNDDYARLHQAIFGAPAEQAADLKALKGELASVAAPPAPPVTAPSGPRKPPPPPVQAPPMGPDGEPEAAVQPEASEAPPEAPPMAEPEVPQPEPEPEPVPQPEAVKEDPAPAPAPSPPAATPPAEAVSSNGSGGLQDWEICENCNNEIETKDQGDLSFIRFKARLCRACLIQRKKAKA